MDAQILETDVAIIGAGPVGLFAIFQLGLVDLKCVVIDTLDRAGGQCAALYPDKPIYDIPTWTVISGQALTDRLLEQIKPFSPQFLFSRMVTNLEELALHQWQITTNMGDIIRAKIIVIAAGAGCLHPKTRSISHNTPHANWGIPLENNLFAVDTEKFETSRKGVFAIGDINSYSGKLKVIISGFHEAALMAQAAFSYVHQQQKLRFQYTTSSSSLQKKLGVK